MTSAAQMKRLVRSAQSARANAHAPYSHFRVGAAILTRSGRTFTGCNVENASFGATLCAERAAVAAMVSEGERSPVACAVVTGAERPAAPCGICRQVLAEFASDLVLWLASEDPAGRVTSQETVKLAALFPQAFRLAAGRRGESSE
jgi:cytidine deaminase